MLFVSAARPSSLQGCLELRRTPCLAIGLLTLLVRSIDSAP